MSRKPSKFRKRKREQREHRTIVSVDIETRSITEKRNNVVTVVRDGLSPADIGTRVHQAVEGHHHVNVLGDTHFGDVMKYQRGVSHDQLMAYAATAGLDEPVLIMGGDIVHHGDKK